MKLTCQPASLPKKLFHISSCILPSFCKNASQILLPKKFLKCVSKTSIRKYKENVVLLVIYLFK